MGQSRPLFVYFRSFHIPIQMTNIQFEQYQLKKSIDGVLGTRTRGSRMEGADKSTELWLWLSGDGLLDGLAMENFSRRRWSLVSAQWTTASFDFHQMAVHKRTTMLAHCNLKQNTWLCSKQSSFFSFYALPSGGKSKDAVVHSFLVYYWYYKNWLSKVPKDQ